MTSGFHQPFLGHRRHRRCGHHSDLHRSRFESSHERRRSRAMLSEPATRIRPSFAATRCESRSRHLVPQTWSTSARTARSGSATHGWPRTRRTRAPAREIAGDWSPPPPPPRMIWRSAHAQEPSSSLSCGAKNPIVFVNQSLVVSPRGGGRDRSRRPRRREQPSAIGLRSVAFPAAIPYSQRRPSLAKRWRLVAPSLHPRSHSSTVLTVGEAT